MLKWAYILCILVNLLIGKDAIAQNSARNISYINTDNGLSQNSIRNIFQDRKGYIWISTADGLNRYDGYNFKVFKNNPKDEHSISFNSGCSIFEDNLGQIWFTHQKGISIFNQQTNQFNNLYFTPYNTQYEVTNPILGLDTLNRLWIWINGTGLKCFKSSGEELFKNELATINSKFNAVYYGAGVLVSNQKIYLGNENSILTIDCKKFNHEINSTVKNISIAYLLNESKILWGGTGFFYIQSIESGKVEEQHLENKEYLISHFDRLSTNEILFSSSTERKLYTYTIDKNSIAENTDYLNKADSNLYNECGILDRSKNLWIGTNYNGIIKINAPIKKVNYYHNLTKFDLVKSITKDKNGNLYFAIYNYGINIYNWKGELIKCVKTEPKTVVINDFGSDYILGATSDGRFYSLNKSTYEVKILKNLTGHFGVFSGIAASNEYRYILGDKSIYKISLNEKNELKYEKVFDLSDNLCSAIFINPEQELMVTCRGSIAIYSPGNAVPRIVIIANSAYAKCIHRYQNKYYYVATSEGLIVYDLNWNLIKTYDESNGLSNTFLYGILEDEESNLWISSNKGIIKFNVEKNVFISFTKNDGLQSNEFNTGAYFKAEDNKLYFGGVNGVNAFYAKGMNQNQTPANGFITQFLVNDEPYPFMMNPILKPDENTVSFEFAANEYTNTTLNEFQYYLDGVDKKWIKSDTKRFARYLNLPAGSYIFRLKCSNNDGIWNGEVLEFPFVITTPFYKTWWFKLLIATFTIAIISAFIFLIYKRNLERNDRQRMIAQQLQLQRERFSRDLHDNIGSRTSLLMKNLETIRSNTTNDEVNLLQTNAKDIMQNLRETVWAMNSSFLSIESLADKITLFAQERMPLDTKLVLEINQEIADDEMLDAEDFLNLYRICQEAINNAIKYSEGTLLILNFTFDKNKKLQIQIIDNGIGVDLKTVQENGFGIANMKARAVESNIEFEFNSNSGTHISLTKQL